MHCVPEYGRLRVSKSLSSSNLLFFVASAFRQYGPVAALYWALVCVPRHDSRPGPGGSRTAASCQCQAYDRVMLGQWPTWFLLWRWRDMFHTHWSTWICTLILRDAMRQLDLFGSLVSVAGRARVCLFIPDLACGTTLECYRPDALDFRALNRSCTEAPIWNFIVRGTDAMKVNMPFF